jgi:hypothetical protein
MRCLKRLVLFFLCATVLLGVVASAQMPSATVPNDDEDLWRTVRELALRVTVLEEELHKQRAAFVATSSPTPTATMSIADVRSSVEGISSSEAVEAPTSVTSVSAIKTDLRRP